MCRWVLGLDKAHIASAPLHLGLPWKLSPGHAFISDGGFLSAGQTSGWNASDHCSWCCQNLAWSRIFSALFSNNWIFKFPPLHLPVLAVIVALHSEDFAFSTFTFHRYKNLNVICALDGLSSCSRYSVWSSLTALCWGILVCVFRLESRMWGFGNPLSQPCLSDDRNPI